MDRAFLIVLSKVIGLRFFGGPFGLSGFLKGNQFSRVNFERFMFLKDSF